jgi:hypothetical protein
MSAHMRVHACANGRRCLCMHLRNLLEIFILVGEQFVEETVLGADGESHNMAMVEFCSVSFIA